MGAEAMAKAEELLDAGDVPGTMRHLRSAAGELTVEELARVTGRVSAMAGFDDLVAASSALAAAPGRPQAMYDFGYSCVEHGAPYLAVPALTAAVRLAPEAVPLVTELAVALQHLGRHDEAVRVLEEREATLPPWPQRYLLVHNAVHAGDLGTATRHAARLPRPDDDAEWAPAYRQVTRTLERAEVARHATPLHRQDLRGWQFVLTGGLLSTLSPYGFASGMTGRYAYTQDSVGACRYGLYRLGLVLAATGRRPSTVSLLADRSSRILGLAAARVFGVPPVPFEPARPDTLVVAYDLNEAGEAPALRDRAHGQVLFEHATCWTDPPAVAADVSTFLHQMVVAPWAESLRRMPDGSVGKTPADDRPEEELAAGIAGSTEGPDAGDGETPPDPDGAVSAFASRVAARWAAGERDRATSPGPVPSSRFL